MHSHLAIYTKEIRNNLSEKIREFGARLWGVNSKKINFNILVFPSDRNRSLILIIRLETYL